MRVRTIALGALTLGLAACSGGEVYPLSVSRVETRLRGMALPDELGFGSGGASTASVASSSDRKVVWTITDHGSTFGWMEATLDPVDVEHTRVHVEFRAADVGGADKAQQDAISAIGTAALSEAVDAELDGRTYNKGIVNAKVAAYALTHRDELKSFVAGREMLERNERDAYVAQLSQKAPEIGVMVREAETQRSMEAASAPTLDLDAK